jgi:hypothetical protein
MLRACWFDMSALPDRFLLLVRGVELRARVPEALFPALEFCFFLIWGIHRVYLVLQAESPLVTANVVERQIFYKFNSESQQCQKY